MFYSKLTGGFYSEEIHGERTIFVIDPNYIAPASGEDTASEIPMIEIANPDCKIPNDAIEISNDEWLSLLDAQTLGKVIQADPSGNPIAADPAPPTSQQLIDSATLKRDQLLAKATLAMAPLQDAVDLDDATADEATMLLNWKKYRVSLNRIGDQPTYPEVIAWPDLPQQ